MSQNNGGAGTAAQRGGAAGAAHPQRHLREAYRPFERLSRSRHSKTGVAGPCRGEGHGATSEFEDEVPVRQVVVLVGLLDDVGQLTGIEVCVPA